MNNFTKHFLKDIFSTFGIPSQPIKTLNSQGIQRLFLEHIVQNFHIETQISESFISVAVYGENKRRQRNLLCHCTTSQSQRWLWKIDTIQNTIKNFPIFDALNKLTTTPAHHTG
jgi:hypothetical protein